MSPFGKRAIVVGILTMVHISPSVLVPLKSSQIYSIPEPTIQVVNPRGFKVTIPDEEGIQLFAFHGNINKPLNDLEAGQISKDILHKVGNKWVFSDNNVKLNNGDVIYYWLYVIKNNLGYRRDDGVYHVQGAHHESEKIQTPINNPRNCDLFANLTETVSYLYKQLADLKETNAILTELVQKSGPSLSKELNFSGELPTGDALFVAEDIIREKLRIHVQVLKAKRLRNLAGKVYIRFEVGDIMDKITIIRTAKEKLHNSRIKLDY